MARSTSSARWLQEHFADPYVQKAQQDNYRGRAVYKLQEINEKNHIIRPGMTIIDLGAAPGSWCQYTTQQLAGQGKLIALDLLTIQPLDNVTFIQGDFQDEHILAQLIATIPENGVDLILSDMAPNFGGNRHVDILKTMSLSELVLDFTLQFLKPNGTLLMKLFHGAGFDALIQQIRTYFGTVMIRKPLASRNRSRETYLLAKNYNLR